MLGLTTISSLFARLAPSRRSKEVLHSFSNGLIVIKKNAPAADPSYVHSMAFDPDTEKVLGAWAKVVNGREHFTSVSAAEHPRATPTALASLALKKAIEESRLHTLTACYGYALASQEAVAAKRTRKK